MFCVAAWLALLVGLRMLVGLRCWLVCLLGLLCWLVCFAVWFALLVGLPCWLVSFAGGKREGGRRGGVCEDELALENENPPTE